MAGTLVTVAQGRSDGSGHLVSASERLSELQIECGGDVPGMIAIPALRELERKARHYGLKLGRTLRASNGREAITAWVEIEPDAEGGTSMRFASWQVAPLPPEDPALIAGHRAAIDRTLAELVASLDHRQYVLSADSDAPDLTELLAELRAGKGRPWTDFVMIDGASHQQPMHWRLLDGAFLSVAGSRRKWRASLIPRQMPGSDPSGFELCLTADVPLPKVPTQTGAGESESGLVGRDIAPVLRQPVARIIANAETIRNRMAGPLADEYSQYAADIAAAGQHLLALVEDLSDLEAVEADDFSTKAETIDLATAAQRTAGILAGRAQEKGISIDPPRQGESLPARAEFRRVLQILLNLVGNAIRYSPDGSHIWIRLEEAGAMAKIIVADQGPGMSADQAAKVFNKFERLGRSSTDGGTGLGLYISRRLARAMGGDLSVDSAPGQGARFILDLPADLTA